MPSRRLLFLFALFLAAPRALRAQYIDPGSSSFLWQLLIVGFLGVVFNLRRHIATLFQRIRGRKHDADSDDSKVD